MELQKLRHLRVINVRNMPEADDPSSWFAIERMFKGIAASVVDLMTLRDPRNEQVPDEPGNPPKLNTVALGSLTYGDVYVGNRWYSRWRSDDWDPSPSHPSLSPLEEFNQLRVYHVDHGKSPLGKFEPTLTLVAKGFLCDDPRYRDIKILRPYRLRKFLVRLTMGRHLTYRCRHILFTRESSCVS